MSMIRPTRSKAPALECYALINAEVIKFNKIIKTFPMWTLGTSKQVSV
jgi:hypothetical protein